MRRALIVAALAAAALLVAAQLALPAIAEREVTERLTENGGEASASISALPATRLLFGDGDRLEIHGSGLELELDAQTEVLSRLDGFGEVEIELSDLVAGPFAIASFALRSQGEDEGTYRLVSRGETTAAALARYGAAELGLPGDSLLGLAAGELLDDAELEVPIRLDMRIASDDGALRVTGGEGTVAGVPAGPIAELITATVVVRL